MNFQMFKLDLKKAEEPDMKLPTSMGSSKKQEISRKTSISALLTTPKPLCGLQQTVGNSERDGNTRKVLTNLDCILQSRDITLPTKVRGVKAIVFPVIMYGCES